MNPDDDDQDLTGRIAQMEVSEIVRFKEERLIYRRKKIKAIDEYFRLSDKTRSMISMGPLTWVQRLS